MADPPASLPASSTDEPDAASPRDRRGSAPDLDRGASAEGDARSAPDDKRVAHRADTIALIERGDRPREVPTYVAIAIIVVLSLGAGLAAYLLRSSQTPAASPSATPASAPSASGSSAAPRRAAPSLSGGQIR